MDSDQFCNIFIGMFVFLHGITGLNITIRGSSQYVVPGRPFTFTCVFNPSAAQSKQLLQNGERFESLTLSNDGSGICYNITIITTICDPSRCSCSQQGAIFTAKWTIQSIDTEYTWKCKEFNDQSPSLFLKLAVPLSSVILDGALGSQIDVVAGQNLSLTCVTGQSRPRSYIMWYIGNDNYTMYSTSTVTNGYDELTSVTSVLTFTIKRDQADLIVNCKAYNIDPNTTVELVTKPKLNVHYGPGHVILSPPTVDYIVNKTYQLGPIKCAATCKPPCSYKWIRPNQDVTQGDTLMISSIQRTQRGTYKCQAYNTVDTQNSTNISVIVHYDAKVTHMEINNGNNFTIPEHSTKTITCLAEGLPQPTITLRYISNNSIIRSAIGLRLDFTFPLVRCEDTGIYKCDAINKFTPQQSLQRNICVLCKPRARQNPLKQHFVLSTGKNLNITVRYLAYPKPTFRWYKNVSAGSLVQITDSPEDVQIKNSVVNTYTFVTEFIRTKLNVDGFGTYILKTSNIIGTDEKVFTVRLVGKPDEPTGGIATCINSTTVVLTWISGSNNGDKQSFYIAYQEEDRTEQSLVSDIIDQGMHESISHTIVSLNELKTYIFEIYSRNSIGESPRLTVNCSTTAKPTREVLFNTGVPVVISLASVIVLIIIVVGVIFSLRRYQSAKGKKDIGEGQVDDRNQLKYETLQTPNDQQSYGQIKMKDKPTTITAERNIYVNTNSGMYEAVKI